MVRIEVPPTDALVADVVAIGGRLGLRIEDPVVLRASLNVIVWLRPEPIVARIQAGTGLVRGTEALGDSLALAAFLAAAGLPVCAPASGVDPGPHVGETGHAITLWNHVEVVDDVPDPADVGRSLADIHVAAVDFTGPMRHVGPLAEIDRLTALAVRKRPADAARLRSLRARIQVPNLPAQPVHGDAHLDNVVMTPKGICWMDWEESWRGPRAWDLAALDHRRHVLGEQMEEIGQAFDGYGAYDPDEVEAWAPAVALWAAAWGVVDAVGTGEVSRRTAQRLDWLSKRFGD